MSAEKTLEKLLRGESDANIRFEETLSLAPNKRFPNADFRQSSYFHTAGRDGAHQPSTRRLKGKAISSSTNPQDSGKLQIAMKHNSYEMIIWWSTADNAYVVDVPELPGCMAHGATRQAAIKNAEDAIRFWIKTAKDDGLGIPAPRGRLLVA
jgi:predicted RNase H-like HicB family nuclease